MSSRKIQKCVLRLLFLPWADALAEKQGYKDLGVEKVEIIGTLDGSTCSICGQLDGKEIPLAQYEPGVTVPPFHPRCRCTTAPVIPEDFADGLRIARGKDGEQYYVPAGTKYGEWNEGKKTFATDSAVKLRAARAELADFTAKTGGRVDSARVSVAGFGRSASSKANAMVRQLPVRESRQQFRDNVFILPPIKGDAVTHRSVYNDLNRSEIGKKTLEWINSGEYNIEINYTTEVSKSLLGRSRGHNVVVYANNTRTVKRTTETLIHEMTHAHYDIGGSQWAEAQCISAEWLHRKGTLTVSDLRAIVKLTKELYDDYSWR